MALSPTTSHEPSDDLAGETSGGGGSSWTAYHVLPRVAQDGMFSAVYDTLAAGKAVGIFPEGGSHDRSELLPLKPGFCLMALGAMAENPGLRVRVLPVGITYFNRHKLNSRCLVQYGRPVEVRQELVTRFQEGGAGKRAAVDELMLEARDALGRVVTTGGTWDELRDFWMLRDLYVPSGMLLAMSTAEQVSLSQAFALDHSRVRQSDPLRVERLMRRVRNYSRKLRANWLTDRLSVMNAYILARAGEDGGRSSPGRLLLLLVPVSGGASLAPAAPVAVAQAALAVHASRRTGRLVARQLLQVRGGQPAALMQRLALRDPSVRHWLQRWPQLAHNDWQPLLP